MKNHNEMYQSLLSRYEEHQGKKKKRILTLKRTIPLLASFCVCAVLGLGYWNHIHKLPSITIQSDVIDEPTLETPDMATSTVSGNKSTAQINDKTEPVSTTVLANNSETDRMTTAAGKQTQTETTVVTDASEAQMDEQVTEMQAETQTPATTAPVTYTQPVNDETDPPVQQTDSVQYVSFSNDYPYYDSVSDLANKANQVFSGRVTNISFELLNMITMQPLKDGEDTQWAMIYTIYEIEAEKVYAGSPTIVKLRIEGGIPSGYEQEQTTLLGSNTIPVMEGAPVLYTGEKYLFALYHADDSEYSSILNPLQSVYAENAVQTGEFSADDIIAYYS